MSRTPSAIAAASTRRPAGLVRVIGASSLADVAFWMMVPLLSLRLFERGIDPASIGLFASLPWVLVVLGAPAAPWLVRRLGAVRALRLAIVVGAGAISVLATLESFALLCVANCLLGISFGLGWVVTDSWVCGSGQVSRRGRLIGLYETLAGLAMGAGPLVLIAVGTEGMAPFITAAILNIAALIATLGVEDRRGLAVNGASPRDMVDSARRHPAIFLCVFLHGALEDGTIAMLPVYAMENGFGEESASLLVGMMGIGSLALVYVVGTLCDRVGYLPVQLAAGAFIVSSLLALVTLGAPPLALLPMVLLWGGLIATLNTTALVEAGSTVEPRKLVGVVSAMVAATTLGSVVGPTVAGVGMTLAPQSGLFCALLCIVAVVGGAMVVLRLRAVENSTVTAGLIARPRPQPA